MWSQPIKTEYDYTAVIAVSVMIPLLITSIIVILFVLRRKRIACFKKSTTGDERAHTHDNEYEMLRPKQKIQRPIQLSELKERIDRMHEKSNMGFTVEFKELRDIEPRFLSKVAESQPCKSKNRNIDILAYDHSRVKLLPIEHEDGSDYINANHIKGYKSEREYIATQAPLPSTQNDFWRMVWEQNVEIIVMLTECDKSGMQSLKVQCDKYWPQVKETVYFGQMAVSLTSESVLNTYVLRNITLRQTQGTRNVLHFSFLNWDDTGCPKDSSSFLDFVKLLRTYEVLNCHSPLVVHCSDGVGRTGTFIGTACLMKYVEDHDEVDIFNLVYEMRNQRCNMVQTVDQYIYIHDSILKFITDNKHGEGEKTEPVDRNNPNEDDRMYENTAFIHT